MSRATGTNDREFLRRYIAGKLELQPSEFQENITIEEIAKKIGISTDALFRRCLKLKLIEPKSEIVIQNIVLSEFTVGQLLDLDNN